MGSRSVTRHTDAICNLHRGYPRTTGLLATPFGALADHYRRLGCSSCIYRRARRSVGVRRPPLRPRVGRLQAFQIVDGLAGLGCGGEDRLAVRFHQLEPLRQVLGVVWAHVLRDAKLGAERGGDDLGDQLLGAVSLVPKPLAQLAVASGCMRTPVAVMPISA